MDTNVLVSGELWRGVPFELLRWAEKDSLVIYTSLEILAEIHRVLHYPKFQQYIDNQQVSSGELFAKIVSLCTIIQADQVVKGVCSDADDEKFLSCALAANAKALISGDKHLLDLKQYQSVRILAYVFRFEFSIPPNELSAFSRTWPYVLIVKMATFPFFHMYKGMWRYTSLLDLFNVIKAVFTSSILIIIGVLMVHRFQGYPRSVFIIPKVIGSRFRVQGSKVIRY